MNNIVFLYVLDTMADWEIGYVTAELDSGRYFKSGVRPYRIVTVGVDRAPVRTMGGLQIVPDITVQECAPERGKTAALILPGGNTWFEERHQPILRKVRVFRDAGIPVGAICGATLALADAGYLDSVQHTSNSLDFMKQVCPNYKGEAFYRFRPAVAFEGLITASGVAPLEFAYELIKALDVFSPETLEAWYRLYTDKSEESFYGLMNSLKQ
jgi:putative intracellular protease/amidase